jgi:hypothetical protein
MFLQLQQWSAKNDQFIISLVQRHGDDKKMYIFSKKNVRNLKKSSHHCTECLHKEQHAINIRETFQRYFFSIPERVTLPFSQYS